MKRHLFILLTALGLASFDASAQWYLFPGFRKQTPDSTVAKTSRAAGKIVTDAPKDSVATALPVTLADTSAVAIAEETDEFVLDIPEQINFSLVLPFESKGRLNSNMMDFYAGALLAARELGKDGLNIDFGSFDCSPGKAGITGWSRSNSDVLIGPISYGDLLKSIDEFGSEKAIVSPLDPNAAQLAKDFPVIHAATRHERQIEDMVLWLKEDLGLYDKVVVVEETGTERNDNTNYLFSRLDSLGIKYTVLSYGILQGLTISSVFEENTSPGGTTRYLIASDKDSFEGDAVRNIGLVHRKHEVALYGTSRLRSCPSIEADDFHSLGARFTSAYFVDYQDIRVKNFILAYRALFQSEPGSFAFSGYDTAHYFLGICAKEGRMWPSRICSYKEQGLQADFSFEKQEGMKGAVNNAVRRIIYNPDYSISIIR